MLLPKRLSTMRHFPAHACALVYSSALALAPTGYSY